MVEKPTYEELEQRVEELEKEAFGRKRLEESMLKEIGRFNMLIEAIPDVVYFKDAQRRHIVVNKACEKLFGLRKKKIIGKTCEQLLPPDLAEQCRRSDEEIIKRREPIRIEEQKSDFKGEKIWLDTIKFPLLDDQGNGRGLGGISRNISIRKQTEDVLRKVRSELESRVEERTFELVTANEQLKQEIEEGKKMEDAMRKNEEKYRSLVESTEDSIYLIDRNLRYLFANEKVISRFSLPIYRVIGRKYGDFHSKKQKKDFTEKIHKVFETGQSLSYEYQSERDDRYFIRTLSPVKEQNGRTISVTLISKDITDRKQAEKALKESEDRFRDIAELLPETIFEMDTEGNLTFVNRMAFDNFGYTKEDFDRGLNCFEMIVPEDRARALKNTRKILKGEEIGLNEYTVLKKDGSTFPVMLHSSPVYQERIPAGVRGIIIDITKRKQAEEELNRERQEFISIFDGIDEIIYISDPETYELLYTNAATKTIFGQDIVGKKCYEVFQSLDKPCSFCSNPIIFGKNIGEPYIWEFQNKVNGRWYRCIDKSIRWPDGRMVRYEMAIDIDDHKQAEEALKEREVELARKNLRLEELNSALKILLEKRDKDKTELEENVLTNMKELVLPYVEKLKKAGLSDKQEVFADILQSNLEDIVSPFAHKLSYKYLNFTPTELKVANLVKRGLTTKEIADLLNSSPETISGHRKSMRKKLKLTDKKSNLRTHLSSLSDG